jgi:hypothetical protein
LLAATAVLAATGSAARADGQTAESETYVQRGIELRRAGRNREALASFEKACELDPNPRAIAQAALAHQALGDWVEAEQGLESALTSADDPWIVKFRDVLEGALAIIRSHLGWLDVQTNVATGELVLDGGAAHYELPLAPRIRVLAKKLDFELRSPGRPPFQRTIDVAPGEEVHVAVALDAQAPAPLGPSPVAPAAPAPDVAPRSDSEGMQMRRLEGYVAIGVAVASAAAGIVAWRVRENQVAVFNDNSRCLLGTMTREQQCGAQARAANVALGAELGAFAIAGVGAGLGAWLLWPSAAPSNVRTARAVCAPWAGYGIACEGRF